MSQFDIIYNNKLHILGWGDDNLLISTMTQIKLTQMIVTGGGSLTDTTSKILSLEEMTTLPAQVPQKLEEKIDQMSNHCLSFCVRKASRVMTSHYDELLSDLGLKSTQVSILVTLAHTGPVGMSLLADRLSLEQSTLSRNLKPLDKGGYINSRPAKEGRGKEVFLTELGLRVVEKAMPQWEAAQSAALKALADCISHGDFLKMMSQLEALRTDKSA